MSLDWLETGYGNHAVQTNSPDPFLGGISLTDGSPDDVPRIDVYPLKGKSVPSIPEIEAALIEQGCQWRRLRELVADIRQHNSPDTHLRVSNFPTLRGIIGIDATDTFFIRFFYDSAKMKAIDALYELDARGLSRTITGVMLAASKLDLKYPSPETYAPAAIAALCNEYDRWPALNAGGPRVGRRVLKQYVDDVIQYLLSMTERLTPFNRNMEIPYYDSITNNVDVVRLWMMVAKKLWHPNVRSRVAQSSLSGLPEWSKLLALYGQVARRRKTISIDGTKFRLYARDMDAPMAGLWPQVLDWERHQTPADIIKYLSANDGVLSNLVGYWTNPSIAANYDVLDSYDGDLIGGLTRAFLRDAAVNGVYVPTGEFTVELPAEYPLRKLGTEALRVWAEPDRLTVSMMGTNGDVGPSMIWYPVTPFRYPLVTVMPFTDVTLAALWRDLRVAGETALPPAKPTRNPPRKKTSRSSRQRKRKRKRVRTLPGKRYVRITGHHRWGNDDERDAIRRRAHGVRGHLRRLRPEWSASEDAAATAEEFGMTLPDGFTFVRPHIRGEGQVDDPGNEVVIRSRGLASVMTLLG